VAGPRRRATRSGLTGTTVNPASTSASTSNPCRVSSTTRIWSRIRLQRQTPHDQPLDSRRTVLNPELLNHSFLRCPQRNVMKCFRPVNTDP
jgi:hypothetical protein